MNINMKTLFFLLFIFFPMCLSGQVILLDKDEPIGVDSVVYDFVGSKMQNTIVYKENEVLFLRADTLYARWVYDGNEKRYYNSAGQLTNKDVKNGNQVISYAYYGGKVDTVTVKTIYYQQYYAGVKIEDFTDSTKIAANTSDASFVTDREVSTIEFRTTAGALLFELDLKADTLIVGQGYEAIIRY